MKLKTFLSTILILLFLFGQAFAKGSKFDRFATDAETIAQTRDDVGLTPAHIPYIMAAPGVIGGDHCVKRNFSRYYKIEGRKRYYYH